MKIQLGDIFKLNQTNQTLRVIGLDDLEVLYDSFWDYNKSWAFASNLYKKGFFYRMSKEYFIKNTTKVSSQELNSEELSVFRTDLPLRFARIKDLSWKSDIFESKDSIKKLIDSNPQIEKTISADKIYICPIGKKGSVKKPLLVETSNTEVKISELLMTAKEALKKLDNDSSDGIGFYRLGIEKGIPTYYIGEYLDMAGIMKNNF